MAGQVGEEALEGFNQIGATEAERFHSDTAGKSNQPQTGFVALLNEVLGFLKS